MLNMVLRKETARL